MRRTKGETKLGGQRERTNEAAKGRGQRGGQRERPNEEDKGRGQMRRTKGETK